MKKTDEELQAILRGLPQLPKGTEWIEFKEARLDFDFDRLGKSFSALSNEANLHGKQDAWLVFGVNDKARIVGSEFRPDRADLDSLKEEIAKKTSPHHTFVEIHEIQDAAGRVILFQIPPAPPGRPVAWNGRCYGRDGDTVSALTRSQIEQIRGRQVNEDWSIQLVANASLKDLDPDAVAQARTRFKQRQQDRAVAASVDGWDDAAFLDRAKLTVDGGITRAAVLLLGRPDSAVLLSPAAARITWRLEGEEKACEHFGPPFLLTLNDVFRRIGNVRLRLQPFGRTDSVELEQYDAKVLVEALANCIAHQDYARQSPVLVTEHSDRLIIENAGTFFEGAVEDYVTAQKPPRHYRNPFLAQAITSLNIVEPRGQGLQRMFQWQRQRFFPLPDYDFAQPDRVRLVIHGKLLDENYSRILISYPDLPMQLVVALDRVQKKLPIPDDHLATLRRFGLVEGRVYSLFPASKLFDLDGGKAEDVIYRRSAAARLKEMIRQLIVQSGPASYLRIARLVMEQLPSTLTERQKRNRLKYILTTMRTEGIIESTGVNQATNVWKLKRPVSTNLASKMADFQ